MSGLVLDASVAAAWCFEDETTPYTERVLDRLSSGSEALVPAIWPYEVANVLLMAERRKRITFAKITLLVELLRGFDILVDSRSLHRAFDHVLSTARERTLSVYDAAYLDLATREGLPLATLDASLRRAARAAGVPLVT